MLTALCLLMILTFTVLIMTSRMSTFTALTIVPVVFALLAGFGWEVPKMMFDGMKNVAGSAAFLLFALLFFATMIDAGLFEPLIKRVLRWTKGDPVRITVGTAVLTLAVALDGDGVTTFLIVTTALVPLYDAARISRLTLGLIAVLAFSIMSGMMPWGGPAARSMAVLNVSQADYFTPFIPTIAGAVVWVLGLSYYLGRREKRRLNKTMGGAGVDMVHYEAGIQASEEEKATFRRPNMIYFNLALTIATMAILIADRMPSAVLFLLAFVTALMANYPRLDDQRKLLQTHAGSALLVVMIVLVGGAFMGILTKTGMVDALAQQLVAMVPQSLAGWVPTIIALVSIPASFVMSNDAYFFGVVPVLAKSAAAYGVEPAQVIRAAVLAQPVHFILPLVPSTIVLIGALGVELRDHIRATTGWGVVTCLVFIVIAILTGSLSFNPF
jgi:citrate-Mg2+:H+ or citrate-Ca2+:H+ symporter, CitMHS family